MERDDAEAAGGSGAEPGPAGPAAGGGADPGLWQRMRGVWANPAYRFVLLFLPYLGAVSLAYPLIAKYQQGIIQGFILATAKIEYWLFLPFSDGIVLKEKMVMFGGFAVKIIDECTGIYEMLIFAAAVLAFPAAWSRKAIGILLGCPLIYLFNVVRIAVLIVVGRYWSAAFDFMHLYFWQGTMIVWIVSIWLLWIIKVVHREEEDAAAAAA